MNRLKIYTTGFLLLLLSIGLSFLIFKFRSSVNFGSYIDPIYHLWLFGPTLASIVFIFVIKKDSFNLISLKNIQNKRSFFATIIVMIFSVLLATLIQYILGYTEFQRSNQLFFLFNYQFSPMAGSILYLMLLLIHAGFAEEFAWRGYLFSKLKTLSWLEMIILLNSIWAIWHFPFMPFKEWYQYLLFWILCIEFGTVLIYVRIKTKSVLSSMILHPLVVFTLSVLFVPYFNIINKNGAGWPNYIVALIFLPISIYYFKKGQIIYNSYAR
ncbi:CPBP family intramembrane glutamic endopeptidase [Plebeiibacterium sediminum]|uniref:CPBP family intramembrane metalloprotease n=1 Tax=Plebeiibacterium sediminum TaxID=2992112 RepID=A0AAE3MAU4_9BACT|nr:CPBP family intramembrane glutamic endopeptidase [Plebeiobacterium sediminum]MCW3789640.1 CPBP family intramembrane metalloprotease [Plebeiobacterium sediminum]